MKALSKADIVTRDERDDAILKASEKLSELVNEFNNFKQEKWSQISDALDELNAAIEDADNFRDDIVTKMSDYFDERSEKWQESEKGQEYQSWMSAWETEIEQVELQEPDDLDVEQIEEPILDNEYPDSPDEL